MRCTTTDSGRIERCSCVRHARNRLPPSRFTPGRTSADVGHTAAIDLRIEQEERRFGADEGRVTTRPADSGAVRSTAGGGDAELAHRYGWLVRAEAVHPPALPQLHDHTVAASA